MKDSRFLRSLLASFLVFVVCCLSWGQEAEEPEAAVPIALVNGQPYLMVTIIDEVSNMDAFLAADRERLLRLSFQEAMKTSKMNYAYSVVFRHRKAQEFVPQLIIDVFDWKYAQSGAFECSMQGTFIDASGETHHLKGSVGFESTLSMSESPSEVEEYLRAEARKAFE